VWWRAALVAVALAGGAFALGRASVDTDGARDEGRAQGQAAGLRVGRITGLREGREVGLRDGRAAGIREGRALQQPASARSAFRAGYTAGANDVFGGFDGGWAFDSPYVITLRRGGRGITYVIDTRSKAP
jgi:hypothetical protein